MRLTLKHLFKFSLKSPGVIDDDDDDDDNDNDDDDDDDTWCH